MPTEPRMVRKFEMRDGEGTLFNLLDEARRMAQMWGRRPVEVTPDLGGTWTAEMATAASRIRLMDYDTHCALKDATLIPLADGQQVVVEKGAWEAAVCRYAGYPTCNTREQAGAVYGPRRDDGSEFEEAWELAEAGATSVLTALFGKDGVVAADKAGVVSHFEGAINEACVVGLEDGHPGHRLVVVNVGATIYIKHKEKP